VGVIRLCSVQVLFVSECRARPFVCWERSVFAFHFHSVGRWEQKCQCVPLEERQRGELIHVASRLFFFSPLLEYTSEPISMLAVHLVFAGFLNLAAENILS